MSKRIKGITIEIGSDTVGLEKALSDVNKKSSRLQSELKDVERLLKFNPGNVEALAQKQKLLADQVAVTTQKLDQLKQAEKQVQGQFANGKISEEQYRNFRREIEFTQGSLDQLKDKVSNLQREQQKTADSTKQLNTLFQATKKDLDDFADVLGTQLTNAIKNGTATSKQLETAIEKVGQEALGVSVDVAKIKEALSAVDNGTSLKKVRKELGSLAEEAKEAEKSVEGLGSTVAGVAGGLAAGGGIAGAIETALGNSSLNTKIDLSFNVPDSSKKSVKDAVKELEAYGIDGEAALEGVRRQWTLNKTASDEVNSAIVKGAATIVSSYAGIDFTELIQETNEIAKELKISQEEALGLTNHLLGIGFPPEQLDIIAEYGQQLQRAGYDGKEIQALFEAGVNTGTWNIDNLLDGLKEGRIKVAEFGQGLDEAQMVAFRAADISGKQVIAWSDAVAKGGEAGSQAMYEIAKKLNEVDDATVKNTLGVQIFGTIYEDQGQNIIDTLLNAKDATVDLAAGQEDLNKKTDKYDADPAIKMNKAINDLKTSMGPLLDVISKVISKIATWSSENPKLAGTIVAMVTGIGILLGICMALAPIFITLSGAAAALGVSVGAVALPVTLVIAGIAALIAIGVLLYKNWDTIMKKGGEFVKGIKNKFNEFKKIDLLEVGENIVDGLIKGISSMGGKVKDKVVEMAQSLPDWMKKVLDINSPSKVTEEIGQFVSQGLAKGIEKDSKKPVEAAKKVAKDTKKSFEAEFKKELKNIDLRLDANQISAQGAINELEKLKVEYKKVPNAVETVNKEIYEINKKYAQQIEEMRKKQFENEKSIIEQRKYYNQISLTQELSILENNLAKYKKGSEERQYYEREIYRVKSEINDKLISINEEYANKVSETNQKLIAEEKKLTDEYNQAVENRTKSLYGFSNLFDEVTKKSDVSGKQLIANLKSQVDTFTEWSNNIQKLAASGIDQGLLGELRTMGPSAAAEIAALNTLSDQQLQEYVRLWRDKNSLARREAEIELEGMKLDTQNKINELRTQTQTDLELYKTEWIAKIKEIRFGTTTELNMKTSLKTIGKDSISGLIAGMNEMTGPLAAEAKRIAGIVSSTIKKALEIRSPSRVTKRLGEYVTAGLSEGMTQNVGSVINAANKLAVAAIPNLPPLENSYRSRLNADYEINMSSPIKNFDEKFDKLLGVIGQGAKIEVKVYDNYFADGHDAGRKIEEALRRLGV
jgi:phage-related minor tail protein